MPARKLLVLLFLSVPAVLAVAGRAGLTEPPRPAGASVEHGTGFRATVDGFASWYGSYNLAGLGSVWCIDHGIPAPDAALAYEPTHLDDRPSDTRRAISWAVAQFGPGSGPVEAAALMLALHDLMGARYPSGPIALDALSPEDLSGFDGREVEVLEVARAMKRRALAQAVLQPPYRLDLSAQPLAPPGSPLVAGRQGELRASVVDSVGQPVPGVLLQPHVTGAVLLGDVAHSTDGTGGATWSFEAVDGENRFSVAAALPAAAPEAFRPSRGLAQRVVRPATKTISSEVAVTAVTPGRLHIVKRGDAQPWLSVAGARLAVDGVGEVVIGADGTAPALELVPGTYVVREVTPPPGYAGGGPWTVEVPAARDATLEIANAAVRGWLHIDKVDGVTGAALQGAVFAVARDAGGDGRFEEVVPDPAGPLLPGRYEITEVTPPAGYLLNAEPVVVEVPSGGRAEVRVANLPVPEVPPPPPPAPLPPPAPGAPAPLAVARGAEELPRTGGALALLAASGLALLGSGLVLVSLPTPRPRRRVGLLANGEARH